MAVSHKQPHAVIYFYYVYLNITRFRFRKHILPLYRVCFSVAGSVAAKARVRARCFGSVSFFLVSSTSRGSRAGVYVIHVLCLSYFFQPQSHPHCAQSLKLHLCICKLFSPARSPLAGQKLLT